MDRRPPRQSSGSRPLDSGHGRVIATIGDVSLAADAERMVAETVAALGRLDVLVNNAGIQPLDAYCRIEDTARRSGTASWAST